MRLVSLLPGATETLAALGAGDRLVGVTDDCTEGVPDGALRLGVPASPDLAAVRRLAPAAVLADTEQNRPDDLAALRDAGIEVHETTPRTVAEIDAVLRGLAALVGEPAAAEPLIADLAAARADAAARVPAPRVVSVTLVARGPWRAVGPDTYADDLLWQCGFANALAGWTERYPRLDEGLLLGADVVLLPTGGSEQGAAAPAFGPDDTVAVADLLGGDVVPRFVDGALLTRHGVRTAAAVRTLSALAVEIAAGLA